jgi:hypothetical protein
MGYNKEPINWGKFKIRCSSLSVLFTEPRAAADKKAGNLSETAKKHLYKVYIREKWGREKDISTVAMKKGTIVEGDIIEILSFLDETKYVKNHERKENEWIQGCPDIVAGHIDDAKGAWDAEAFAPHIMDQLSDENFYQMQGYLWLFNRPKGKVSRALVNCPDFLLKNELRRLMFNMDVATDENPEYKAAALELIGQLTYDDIPLEERIIRKEVIRDDEIIAQIPAKVQKAREFLMEMERTHKSYNPKGAQPKPPVDLSAISLIKIKK